MKCYEPIFSDIAFAITIAVFEKAFNALQVRKHAGDDGSSLAAVTHWYIRSSNRGPVAPQNGPRSPPQK